MKNLILSLAFIFSISAVAQKQATQEEVRAALATGMVSFVESVKPAYKTGMTSDQFQNVLTGGGKPTAEGAALIKKAHEYISTGTSASRIQSSYSGKEFAGAHLRIETLKQNKSIADGSDLFGISQKGSYDSRNNGNVSGCQWWNLPCHIASIVEWIGNNILTLCVLAYFAGYPCP